MSRYRITVALWAVTLCASTLFAQPEKQYRLRGEVTGGSRDQASLSVELVDLAHHLPFGHTLLSQAGAFEFSNVPVGSYQVRVVTPDGTVIRQENHVVNQLGGDVVIALPEMPSGRPAGGSVSVAMLKHKIPAKAKKAFATAQKRLEANDMTGSAEMLRQAIALNPNYLEAHNNLGCRLLSLGRTDEAIASFLRAIEIDARAPFAHANLAVALLQQQRPAEAEQAARLAIQTDGGIAKTKYVLGMALFGQHKFTLEAAQSLHQSEDEFPTARLAAAAVFERLGEVKEAKAELNTYLDTPGAIRRSEVKAWLSRLK